MTVREVCVVGGGPAGLAAALAVARSGRKVTVLDTASPPMDKACGEGLMPESVAALVGLGISKSVLMDAGHPFSGIRFISEETSVSATFPKGQGLGLRRTMLHQIMVDHAAAAGIRMLWGIRSVRVQKGRVEFAGGHAAADLIVGADGQRSGVRRAAGLNQVVTERRRFGFRRHYQIQPWSPFVEVYWQDRFQIYITPVSSELVCVAVITEDSGLRLEGALKQVPGLVKRLFGVNVVSAERGSLSVSRQFKKVCGEGVVLLGDASGSVDAITGEGLGLAFRQASALVEALDAKDLGVYEARHRALSRKPLFMAGLMRQLGRNQRLQHKVLAALSLHQPIFASVVAAHVGHLSFRDLCSWGLVNFGLDFLGA